MHILNPALIGGLALGTGVLTLKDKPSLASNTLIALGSIGLGHSANKYAAKGLKRGVETIMRTTHEANPLPDIWNAYKANIDLPSYMEGDKNIKKLLNVVNYVATGAKKGPKGYYNSILPTENGVPVYYSGFMTNDGGYKNILNANDAIDAFVFNKTIDPKYGVKLVNSDLGVHKNYVKANYPNKNISVYEVVLPELKDVKPIKIEGSDADYISFANPEFDSQFDAAGHILETGIKDGVEYGRGQDIWKFNPKDYISKYLNGLTIGKKLLKAGLSIIDDIGNPFIVRGQWLPKANWIEEPILLKRGNKILIKKENRGKFTKSAKLAGLSVLQYAKSVLASPHSSKLQKKRALFAINASKWNK